MLLDAVLTRRLAQERLCWRIRCLAQAATTGGAVFALTLVAAIATGGAGRSTALGVALVAALMTAAVVFLQARRMTMVDAARAIERAHRSFDNLLVTAAELTERPRPVDPAMQAEVFRLAAERAQGSPGAAVTAFAQPLGVAAMVMVGCAWLSGVGTASLPASIAGDPDGLLAALRPGSFEVRITPPSYTRRPVEVLKDPVQISVLAGSRLQIAAIGRDWVATDSEAIEIKAGESSEPRFLAIAVVPDLAPTIRIVTPGRDTALRQATGGIEVAIQSGDDLALASLSLRFTKASGGGESMSFSEGEVPLRIERSSEREWRARAEFALDQLGLADGDILVYRAIARDANPAGTPVQSDQFLIEIGKNAEIADAGFALPSEEKKYAISQQMVIYHTEQLLTNKPRLRQGSSEAGSEWLNESRGIAVEQRMVRAEVVFLGGGEVEDEVEEAAQSDELAEGRLQNSGRAEMLRAINAMSRAEAELNGGRAAEALRLERLALTHLERALDRRRYFLRTLPDRSRIDPTRRLTGERREARSWDQETASTPAQASMEAQRRVMRELAAGATVSASLAARVAAVDPASPDLQKAAVALASASSEAARREATQDAMAALTRHALRSLHGSSAIELRHPPLAGSLSRELSSPSSVKQ